MCAWVRPGKVCEGTYRKTITIVCVLKNSQDFYGIFFCRKIGLFRGKYGALLRKIHECFEIVCAQENYQDAYGILFGRNIGLFCGKCRALLRKMWVSFAGNVGMF